MCPYLELEVGKGRIRALVDSGSARCLISSRVYQQLVRESLIRSSTLSSVVCWTASREVLPTSKLVAFKFKINYFSWVWEFLVAPNLSVDCIVGADFIVKSGLVLDIQGHVCFFKFNRAVRIPFFGYRDEAGEGLEELQPPASINNLSQSQQTTFRQLCEEFPEVLTANLGLTHNLEYRIRLCDSSVVRSHPYKFAPPKMTILREKVQELLDQGVIEPSTSAYASPPFLVPKPGGKHRLVIDYRKLNQNIEVESVPLPDLHSAFDWFSQARYFTIFDLNSACLLYTSRCV